jgi:hypothetical protein
MVAKQNPQGVKEGLKKHHGSDLALYCSRLLLLLPFPACNQPLSLFCCIELHQHLNPYWQGVTEGSAVVDKPPPGRV